jgi:DNA polymerase I-like protein with 3'-5' exonuclease and polymerase domains
LEPVLYSWISGDDNLFDFFYNGRGYLDVCKRVLGRDITKQDRIYKAVKSMTLGIFYNMQDKKMAMNLWQGAGIGEPFKFSEDWGEHREQVAEKRKKILSLFPRLVRYMEKQKLMLYRDKQITASDGFVRHLPNTGPNGPKAWSLANQAINFPVQHLASMVTGCAMIDCEEMLLKEYNTSYSEWHKTVSTDDILPRIINEVHDELTFDLPFKTNMVEPILSIMSRPPTLTKLIPGFNLDLKVEATITDRWGDK